MHTRASEREVWVTPKVAWYLCDPSQSETARTILEDIETAKSPSVEADGAHHSKYHNACLVTVLPPLQGCHHERIVVWSGPHDGFFFHPERSKTLQRWESNAA